MDKKRLKNYGLWTSVASLVLLVLQMSGVSVVPDQYDVLVNSILTVLVGLGLISNPTTDAKGFGDDKAESTE